MCDSPDYILRSEAQSLCDFSDYILRSEARKLCNSSEYILKSEVAARYEPIESCITREQMHAQMQDTKQKMELQLRKLNEVCQRRNTGMPKVEKAVERMAKEAASQTATR